ncbi:MAG: ATP-binding cassette domain-containing protein [Bacteroidales bacterium]|nr:ATP-binding cassette domain-containing protein [Bacteroidales bacterium]
MLFFVLFFRYVIAYFCTFARSFVFIITLVKKYLSLLKYLKPYLPKVGISLSFNLLSVFFSLFSLTMLIPVLQILFNQQPLVSEPVAFELNVKAIAHNFNYLISHVILTRGKISALVFVSLVILIFIFLKNAFQYLSVYFLAPVRTGVIKDIRNTLFRKIIDLPLGYYSGERKGDIISRITTDVNEIEASIIRSLDLFFREPVMIIVYLGSLIYMSPGLTLFVLILLPISGLIIGRIGRTLRRNSAKVQKAMGSLLSIIEEAIGGLRIIKAFNAEEKTHEKFYRTNDQFTRLMIKNWRRRDLASPLSEFLGVAILILVMWYGGTLVLGEKSELSSAEFITYIGIFSQVINPAKQFTNAYYSVVKGMASVDRVNYILDTQNTIVEKKDALSLREFREAIVYRDVSFRYNTTYVLRNINLTIEKGKTIAIVGQSGSGKSTLVDLLPRFYDVTEGDILIDGYSVKDYKIQDLRNLIGYVNQDPILFNDTFFNNIAFGVENATEEEVINAAQVANAHEFIISSPEGYQTFVGDRGGNLSGGQRQRISIARAVLKNPPILILDEATSSLDSESERLVQDALFRLMKNRTSLVIAHRLSTVQYADEICVLNKGEIIERGKHEELLKLNGAYRRLYDIQMFV